MSNGRIYNLEIGQCTQELWIVQTLRKPSDCTTKAWGRALLHDIIWLYLTYAWQRTKEVSSLLPHHYTGCPKKHGNSVTNLISSLILISIVIPNFKSHNIIMPARVYSMKRVKDCKDVSIISPQDEQWRRTSYSVCILQFSCFTKYNRMQSKHKQTKCEHSRRNSYRLQLSQ